MNRREFIKTAAWAGVAGAASRMFASNWSGTSDTVLPNGLRLPSPWPPPHGDPASPEPMLVPYLARPPEVIPIDLGRQLFVDDFLVEHTDLRRRFHRPDPVEGNPVLYPETADEREPTGIEGDERAVCYLGHGGVFFDPSDRFYKMFYTAGWRGGLALAVSRDGLKWERPDLGLAGGNLILPPGNENAGGDNCVWLDLETENPDERFKMITTRGRAPGSRNFVHTLHTSPDGLRWNEGVQTGPASDYCSFYFDPFRRVWVYSIKRNGPRGRCRHYAESPDFLRGATWDNAVYWVNSDRLDRPDPEIGDPPQLYSLNGVAYESLTIGMHYIHRGPNNRICSEGKFPKLTNLSLGFTRDGFHWDRPERTPFLEASREEGRWDRAYLHSTAGVCLVSKDRLLFPYTGYSGQAPDGTRGMYTGASIGMASLRRDGFASLESTAAPGTVATRPVRFSGRCLFVNVACLGGGLKVEVLDRTGRVIEPFREKNCRRISVDSTMQRVEWESADLERLRGEPVRFRFHLENGSSNPSGSVPTNPVPAGAILPREEPTIPDIKTSSLTNFNAKGRSIYADLDQPVRPERRIHL